MDKVSRKKPDDDVKTLHKTVFAAPLKTSVKYQSNQDSILSELLNNPETILFNIFNHEVKRSVNIKELNIGNLDSLNEIYEKSFWPCPQFYACIHPRLVSTFETYVDWIYEVFYSLNLQANVFFSSIIIWLKALAVFPVDSERQYKTLLLTSLLIQSKIEDNANCPSIDSFVYHANIQGLNRATLLEFEKSFLNSLNFEITTITFRDYIKLFTRHNPFNQKDYYILNYLSLLILRNCDYYKYHPAEVAAALIAAEFRISNKPFSWTKSNFIETGYSYDQIKDLSFDMVRLYEKEAYNYNISEEINQAPFITQKNAASEYHYCSIVAATHYRNAEYLLNGATGIQMKDSQRF